MLADALEHLVRGLVPNPDDVRVRESDRGRVRTLEVRVHPEDIGKVIQASDEASGYASRVLGSAIQVSSQSINLSDAKETDVNSS